MLLLLLLCFFLLRLLVLLRRRDVSQKLRELLSLQGTQERSQVCEDASKSVCIRRGLVSCVVGISGCCWFAWLSTLGLLGLSDLLSLRLPLSWLCVLGSAGLAWFLVAGIAGLIPWHPFIQGLPPKRLASIWMFGSPRIGLTCLARWHLGATLL